MEYPVIKNKAGAPILLNAREAHNAKWIAKNLWERNGSIKSLNNSLGYDVAITTLTTISKKITEQSFYEIPFADYLPVVAGEGTWSDFITVYRSFNVQDDFETGIINTGGDNSRLAAVDTAIDALNIKVFGWAKSMGYTIFDLEYAAKSGNWDLVSQKEKSRKINADLGLQRIAFLGAKGNNGVGGSCLGLLNQSGVTTNPTVITKPIKLMTPSELKTFQGALIETFRANCQRSAWPDRFVIPESDYNGLASQASPEFPVISTLKLLEDAFKLICRNPDFKILPLAYADAAYSQGVLSSQTYALYRSQEETLKIDLPLPYTTSLANSIDNFAFQNVGYLQYTGVLLLRPLELMYFTFTL